MLIFPLFEAISTNTLQSSFTFIFISAFCSLLYANSVTGGTKIYFFSTAHSSQQWPDCQMRKNEFAIGEEHLMILFKSILAIDIESLQNRLLKVCYVFATSASLNKLLFFLFC
jgi:hypothetical protein